VGVQSSVAPILLHVKVLKLRLPVPPPLKSSNNAVLIVRIDDTVLLRAQLHGYALIKLSPFLSLSIF
jgi:hypothetical protein